MQCKWESCKYEADQFCNCGRCIFVKATGFCNTYHRDYYVEERELHIRKAQESVGRVA